MKTYKEQSEGVIEWREVDGESTTIGLIIEGQTKTRQGENGDTETFSPWDELMDSGAEIEWRDDEEKAAQAAQELVAAAKSALNAELDAMTYTVEAGGVIQVRPQDEIFIKNAIAKMQRDGTVSRDWRTVDNGKTTVTIADLEAAVISGQDQTAAAFLTHYGI